MKFLVAVLAVSTTFAAGSAVYLAGTRSTPIATPQSPVVGSAARLATATEVPSVPRRSPADRSELVGRLAAATEYDVQANGRGFVLHARVDPGDFVEKGQTLVELENPTSEEPVRRAETALELAKSELEAQQRRRADAEQRREGLLGASLAGRGISGGMLRMARLDEQQARARVAEAEANLQKARQAEGDMQVVSPVSGYVAERRVSVGDKVEPGMTVLRIVDGSMLKLVVELAEGDLAQAVPASAREAMITFDALPERQFVGQIVRSLSREGHPNALTIEVANSDRLLKPGMSGRVRLVSEAYGDPGFTATSRYGSIRREPRNEAGPSEGVLLRGVLVSLKGLAVTLATAADAQTKELARKQAASQVTVEATTQYFGLLERQVTDLRPDSTSHHAVSLEKAADEIDNLPILHVDEELVAFGADVAQNLRAMAERRRSISRTRSYTDVTMSEEAQVENSAIRTQGMQKITVALASMRRKMTKKYNLEFLANAGSIHTASVTKRRITRR
ncbi:MAG TPA: efflux RND transporter periplasmic adaptor subunit [Planctomycetaceae bacterium]|nr:efflux RND transporter periplasmic adaptor subunit [Planctomycetaceae bacterium]